MWFVWGPSTGVKELGVVAEQCPICKCISPCRLVGRFEGFHVYFITMAASVTKTACTCSLCGGQFPGEFWRYGSPVPPALADSMPIEELIKRTNPGLKDRIEHEQKLEQHQADPQFTKVLKSLEQLRPGNLHKQLMNELLQWDQMDDIQRVDLVTRTYNMVNSLAFARSIVGQMPQYTGCFIIFLSCAAVWFALLFIPGFRNLLWGGISLFACLAVAGSAWQMLLVHHIRSWTKDVLVPEGKKIGIDFHCFMAVLADLPPSSPQSEDELRHLKEYENVIREELVAAGAILEES
jgi:hypothetical protein